MDKTKFILLPLSVFLLFSCTAESGKRKNRQPAKQAHSFRILQWDLMTDTLEIVSGENFVWNPLAVDLSAQSIRKKESGFKTIKSGPNQLILTNGTDTLYFKKTRKGKTFRWAKIIIRSGKHYLKNRISVGMSKWGFIQDLGIPTGKFPLKFIRVIRLFDPVGENIEQNYSFDDDTLHKIVIKQSEFLVEQNEPEPDAGAEE